MKGLNMRLKDHLLDVDHHTFLAPANIKLPDSIGMYCEDKRFD